MSTFRAFQTGLEAGQNQAKTRREDDARKKATEAYGMGDYEGAVTGLMGAGLTQDASNYNTLGQQAQTRKQQQGYATALGSAPDQRTGMQNLRGAAMQAGDPETMLKVDEALKGMDADQAAKFGEGMNFLGQTALGLKGVPPEARGQAAIEAIQNSPYANPQIMQQIQQAAADGKITDDELDNFAMQTMSVAERVKASKPQLFNTGQSVVSVSPGSNPKAEVLYRDEQRPSGSSARLRPATPQEAQQYGPPGTMGQIDDTTGRFYPTARPNPQSGGLATEGERKFGLYAKTARDALVDIEGIEFGNGIDADPTFDRGGELNPFDGTARKYDQAIDRFLDGWSRAMTGAAMTNDEKQFYYGIMKPTFGDDPSVRKQKASERRAMVERLKAAAARGYEDQPPEVVMPEDGDEEDSAFLDSLFGKFDQIADAPPAGVEPALWAVMDDEDKAAFR